MRDSMNICTLKSSELRKFWNCTMNAVCSSSDFSAKFREDARRIARIPPLLSMTMPSRTSETGTNSCVDFLPARRFCSRGGMLDFISEQHELRKSYTQHLSRKVLG